MLTKKSMGVILAAMGLGASLFMSGCGGGSTSSNGPAIPHRTATTTQPLATFQFGNKTAKVYDIKGVKMNDYSFYVLAADKNSVYLKRNEVKQKGQVVVPQQLEQLRISKETLQESKVITVLTSNSVRATANDKGVFFIKDRKTRDYAWYDSKSGKLTEHIKLDAAEQDVTAASNGKYYYANMMGIYEFTFNDGKVTEKMIIDRATLKKLNPNGDFYVEDADNNKLYVATYFAGNTPGMMVLDFKGVEKFRIEGVKDLPRTWAVTTNYIMHAGSDGDVKIFNKVDGKLLGTTKVNGLRFFKATTATGNDVYMSDDRNRKLYRIDL